MERRLGKGLGSLLGESEPRAGSVTMLSTAQLRPNPFQPRRTFEPGALQELGESLRRHGMLQPIVARRAGDRFEIVSGERRWRASQLVGIERVPVVVREQVDDREMLELALVENLQRRDLNPIERATGFRSMCTQLSLTQEQVAERVGLQRSTVANHLRLLDLPAKVQEALGADLIQMGHARALLGLTDARQQVAVLEAAVRDSLSVREVEARVRSSGKPAESGGGAPRAKLAGPAWATELSRRLETSLGAKVRVVVGPDGRSQIIVECFSNAELHRVAERLAPRARLE